MGFHNKWGLYKLSFNQPLRTIPVLLSILGMGISAIAPLPSQAVSFPGSTPSGGAPPRTASGAPRRSECKVVEKADLNNDGDAETWLTPMTAIVPVTDTVQTAHAHPIFFVYMPQNTATSAQIVVEEKVGVVALDTDGKPILNENGNPKVRYERKEVYVNNTLSIPNSVTDDGPRIVAYKLNDLELEPGRTYEWSFALLCGNPEPFTDALWGEITCIQSCSTDTNISGVQNLNESELTQAAQDYAARELWIETLSLTAQLRPFDQKQWSELLESQSLGCLANTPFADDSGANFTVQDDPKCFVDGNSPQF